jgi:hypothetical protein
VRARPVFLLFIAFVIRKLHYPFGLVFGTFFAALCCYFIRQESEINSYSTSVTLEVSIIDRKPGQSSDIGRTKGIEREPWTMRNPLSRLMSW